MTKDNLIKIIGIGMVLTGISFYGKSILSLPLLIKNVLNAKESTLSALKYLTLTVIYFALYTSSGIGLIFTKKWGWYLGSFNFVFIIIRNLYIFPLFIISLVKDNDFSNSFLHLIIGNCGTILIGLILLSYLLKTEIREHFLIKTNKRNLLIFMIVISVLIIGVRDLPYFINVAKSIR